MRAAHIDNLTIFPFADATRIRGSLSKILDGLNHFVGGNERRRIKSQRTTNRSCIQAVSMGTADLSMPLHGLVDANVCAADPVVMAVGARSEEHTSELQSQSNLVCRLLLEKKNSNDC